MSTFRAAAGATLVVAALGALACADGLFAPGAHLPARAELAMSGTSAPDSALFESVDAIRVRIARPAGVLLDSTLAFRSAGAETRVRVGVELQSSREVVYVDVELKVRGSTAFRGTGSATLKRSENTVVPITLSLAPAGTAAQLAPPS